MPRTDTPSWTYDKVETMLDSQNFEKWQLRIDDRALVTLVRTPGSQVRAYMSGGRTRDFSSLAGAARWCRVTFYGSPLLPGLTAGEGDKIMRDTETPGMRARREARERLAAHKAPVEPATDTPRMDPPQSRFGRHTDAQLVEFWNQGDGGLSWLIDLENELNRRGYTTRCRDLDAVAPRLAEGSERLYLTTNEGGNQ